MRVNIFFLIVFLLSYTGIAKSQNRIKWKPVDNLAHVKAVSDKLYFIYFYYNDCRWCKELETTTFLNDYTARFINQKFHAYKINAVSEDRIEFNDKIYRDVKVGKYDFNELAVSLLNGKMSFPAMIILDEKLQKIGVHQNYYNVDDFHMILAYYAGGHYKTTLFRHYANNYCKDSHFYNLVSDK